MAIDDDEMHQSSPPNADSSLCRHEKYGILRELFTFQTHRLQQPNLVSADMSIIIDGMWLRAVFGRPSDHFSWQEESVAVKLKCRQEQTTQQARVTDGKCVYTTCPLFRDPAFYPSGTVKKETMPTITKKQITPVSRSIPSRATQRQNQCTFPPAPLSHSQFLLRASLFLSFLFFSLRVLCTSKHAEHETNTPPLCTSNAPKIGRRKNTAGGT